jgi:enamine deaminase RidA (YjgF/YER057c/UK114 family)
MSHIERIETTPRASRAVIHNGTVYLAGAVAENRDGDIREQTRQALEKIDRYLAAAGTDKSRLLSAQIFLKDVVNDFAGMNEVWDAWTSPGAAPARATVQGELGLPSILVEIVATAAV